MSKIKTSLVLDLYAHHVTWLEEMQRRYGLPDLHKTVRVLLDHARHEGNLDTIFTKIRCARPDVCDAAREDPVE